MRARRLWIVLIAGLVMTVGATQAFALTLNPGYYWTELQNWFIQGGTTMWLILVCSIVTIAFTVERLVRLRRRRIAPMSLAERARELWRAGRTDELADECRKDGSLLARAIVSMIEHRDVSIEHLRMIVGDTMSSELRLHFRRVHPLAASATIAPLLGLFGTITGIIGAFKDFRLLGETGDPSVFAGNISKALVTTQFGLIVAIVTLALWNYFRNRTNTYADEAEVAAQDLMVDWFVAPEKKDEGA